MAARAPLPGIRHTAMFITVWALDVDRLPLDATAAGAMVGFFLHQHVIGTAALTLRYER